MKLIGVSTTIIFSCLFIAAVAAKGDSVPSARERDDMARARVFQILHYSPNSLGGGTGWLTADAAGKPILVTNAHVCGRGRNLPGTEVYLKPQGDFFLYKGTIRKYSNRHDLCIVDINKDVPASSLYIISKEVADVDSETTTYGYGHLGPLNAIRGKIKSYEILQGEPFEGWPIIRLTSEAFPGNSGSPIVNNKNEVVGVLFGIEQRASGDVEALIVPLSYLTNFLSGAEEKARARVRK